jgi:hypothetical protein
MPPPAVVRPEPRRTAPKKTLVIPQTKKTRSTLLFVDTPPIPGPPPLIEEKTTQYRVKPIVPAQPELPPDKWEEDTVEGMALEVSDPMPFDDGSDGAQNQKKKSLTKTKKSETTAPSLQSLRVAVGRNDGVVYVRLFGDEGLRDGEHEAMLVALNNNDDVRSLFK